MADGTFPRPLSALLQELAEGLQSVGSYLGAVHRIRSQNTSEHVLTADMIEKAVDEIVRAQTAFHQLRDHLRSDHRDETDVTSAPVQTDADLPVGARQRNHTTG